MKQAQEQELVMVEDAQKMQFNEFQEAWDKYMKDYENAAFESIERLKVRSHCLKVCIGKAYKGGIGVARKG